MKDKQQAGVWLDHNRAIIITSDAGNEKGEYSVKDKVNGAENFGGGSEHTMNNSRQADTLKFFKTLSGHLSTYNEVLIFGPGKSQEQFKNHLNQDAQFKNKKITIESSDHLTDPQMIAKVRDHFA